MTIPLAEHDPRSIGEITIDARLGEGGSAVVYLGTMSDGRKVAVKVLHPHLATSPSVRDVLRREAVALERVQGPRVARILDIDVDGERPYLVMEYISGQPLSQFIGEQTLAGALLTSALEGIADALESIHAAGVIHRDLKPSNVIFGPDGVYVVDFGISVVEDVATGTRTGTFQGTPSWLSPEQAIGKPLNAASDVFNFGMLIVFATTGANPFGEGRPDAMLYRVVNEEPNISGVPTHLQDLARRCLAKEPKNRPTLDQVRADLALFGGSASGPTPNETVIASTKVLASFRQAKIGKNKPLKSNRHGRRTGLLVGFGIGLVIVLCALALVIVNAISPFGGAIVVADNDSSRSNTFLTEPTVIISVKDGEGDSTTLTGAGERAVGSWTLNSKITVDYKSAYKDDESFSRTWSAQELGLNVFSVSKPLMIVFDVTDDSVSLRVGVDDLFGRETFIDSVLSRGNEKEYIGKQSALYRECITTVSEGWEAEFGPILNSTTAYNDALEKNSLTEGGYADWDVWGARAEGMADDLFVALSAAGSAVPSQRASTIAPYTSEVAKAADTAVGALQDSVESWDLYSSSLYAQYGRGAGQLNDLFPRELSLIDLAENDLWAGVGDLYTAIPSSAKASCAAKFPDAQ